MAGIYSNSLYVRFTQMVNRISLVCFVRQALNAMLIEFERKDQILVEFENIRE